MHKDLMKVKESACEFLKEIGRDGVNMRNIEPVYMAAVAAEKIMKMMVLEEDAEYSHRGTGRDDGYSRNSSYRDGESYRMGDSYMGGRSYDDGTKQLIMKLERMREEAEPKYKDAFQRFIGQLQDH